jgi:hypothetical protein
MEGQLLNWIGSKFSIIDFPPIFSWGRGKIIVRKILSPFNSANNGLRGGPLYIFG